MVAGGRWIRLFNTSLNPRYYGAKGDGTTDDSTAFNNCLASTYASHVDVSNGTYIVRNLSISSARTVTLTAGATLKLKASAGADPILAISGQYTKVSGGVFDGNKANQASTNIGIDISADDVTVQNCRVTSTSWIGIHGTGSRPVILNNYVQNTDYIGIFCQTSGASIEGGVIQGNTVDRSSIAAASIVEGGLKVHGDVSNSTAKWRITNNLIKLPISPAAAACVCIEVQSNTTNCVIANNITNGGQIGITSGVTYSSVSGNTIAAASLYGIEAGVSFVTVTGNTIYGVDDSSGTAVTLRGITIDGTATNCTVSANTIYDVTENAIYLTSSRKYISITGNSISLPSLGAVVPYAINLDGTCSYINITGNQLLGNATNAAKGIAFSDGTFITISSNSFDTFTQNGILMIGSGTNVTDNVTVMNNVFHSVNVAFAFQAGGTSSMGNNIVVFGNTGLKNYLDFKNEVLLITGSGTPQAVVTASVGAEFLRNDGGANTTLYIKESGTNTNTGWVAK